MADVILIQPHLIECHNLSSPSSQDNQPATVPMGLLYLGSMLHAEGYKVKIIDTKLYGIYDSAYLKEIELEMKDAICVGISVMSVGIYHGLRISDLIKSRDPYVPIVWGGVHPTLFPKETCNDSSVNYVVIGEGELALLELVRTLERGGDPSIIKGLAYKDKNGYKENPPGEPIDMNTLPFPAWHLLNVQRYLRQEDPARPGRYVRSLQIHTSRGCPYRCSFCINTVSPYKGRWRGKRAEKVLDEIEFLVEKYKVEHIWFRDELFFANKARMERICDGLKERRLDIEWWANVRADYFNSRYLTGNFLKKVRECGFTCASMGAESGSTTVLDFLKKDITVQDILNSAKECRKHDIIPTYSFMIGVPSETGGDMLKTLSLIRQIKKICPKANILGPQLYRPYPGSELYDLCKKLGFKEPRSLREWADENLYPPVKLLALDRHALSRYPWIKDPELVTALCVYTPSAFQSPRRLLHGNLRDVMKSLPFSLLARFKLRLGVYSFPYEWKLYDGLRRCVKSAEDI